MSYRDRSRRVDGHHLVRFRKRVDGSGEAHHLDRVRHHGSLGTRFTVRGRAADWQGCPTLGKRRTTEPRSICSPGRPSNTEGGLHERRDDDRSGPPVGRRERPLRARAADVPGPERGSGRAPVGIWRGRGAGEGRGAVRARAARRRAPPDPGRQRRDLRPGPPRRARRHHDPRQAPVHGRAGPVQPAQDPGRRTDRREKPRRSPDPGPVPPDVEHGAGHRRDHHARLHPAADRLHRPRRSGGDAARSKERPRPDPDEPVPDAQRLSGRGARTLDAQGREVRRRLPDRSGRRPGGVHDGRSHLPQPDDGRTRRPARPDGRAGPRPPLRPRGDRRRAGRPVGLRGTARRRRSALS